MYKELIIKELSKVNRRGISELLEYLDKNGFYTAPCSVKYHCNYIGGLAEHSWNVYVTFRELLQKQKIPLAEESIILCGLLHDICKIDLFEYDWDKEKFSYTKTFPIGHGEKSVILIMRYIPLTDEECCIIRWHMNRFDVSFNGVKPMRHAINLYPSVAIIHAADLLCAVSENKNIGD